MGGSNPPLLAKFKEDAIPDFTYGNVYHGRRSRRYKKGETRARYGLMHTDADGVHHFMQEQSFSMSWGTEYAGTWSDPPHHYWEPGLVIVNFNKKTCPVKLGAYSHKSNYEVIPKEKNQLT